MLKHSDPKDFIVFLCKQIIFFVSLACPQRKSQETRLEDNWEVSWECHTLDVSMLELFDLWPFIAIVAGCWAQFLSIPWISYHENMQQPVAEEHKVSAFWLNAWYSLDTHNINWQSNPTVRVAVAQRRYNYLSRNYSWIWTGAFTYNTKLSPTLPVSN